MKQFEISKKEYINRLKNELDTVEERFHKLINQNSMVGEDYRSIAMHNWFRLQAKIKENENLNQINSDLNDDLDDKREQIRKLWLERE